MSTGRRRSSGGSRWTSGSRPLENRKGVLATIAAAISGLDVNIDAVGIVDRDGINSRMAFTIEVSGRTHLAQVFRRLRAVPLVRRIVRHA